MQWPTVYVCVLMLWMEHIFILQIYFFNNKCYIAQIIKNYKCISATEDHLNQLNLNIKHRLRRRPRQDMCLTLSTCAWIWLESKCFGKNPIKLPPAGSGSNLTLLTADIMTIHSLTKNETIKMGHLHSSIFQKLECSAQWSVGSEVLAVDTCSSAIIIIHPLSALAFVIQNKCNCLQQRGGFGAH